MPKFFTPKISGFGIDLSDLSIKIINLKKGREHLELASWNRQEINEGLIEEGEIKKEEELIELIKKAVKETKGAGLKTKYCIVSLPETESYLRMLKLPLMKKEEVAEAIKWELEANIPLGLNDIFYDWQIIDPLGAPPAKELDVLVGVLPKKTVEPYLDVLKKAGLKPFIFEIESVATARALIKGGVTAEPIAILDFGAKRTSFFIWYGQAIYFTTSLPVSNNSLVKTLSEKLEVSEEKAREIKIKVGLDQNHSQSQIFAALKPPLLELVNKLRVFIDFYREHYQPTGQPDSLIKEILLCGGGANLAGLDEFISSQLDLNVHIGNPWVNISANPPGTKNKISIDDPLAFSTALGLALRNFEEYQ